MIIDKQKGVSLIMTFFIMIILLSVVLSISVILYSEIKIVRNVGNSVVSFYAADSGIEKVLYYDRQVKPAGAIRGLCSMFDDINNSDRYCKKDLIDFTSGIYCNSQNHDILNGDFTGCDLDKCNNCWISFETTFDGMKYTTRAEVSPDATKLDNTNFKIESKGIFNGTQRQIQIIVTPG
ncbi:MAG: pilus assembly PilX N-terminal domain-containing protein [Candidatus Staskawiczbacteria bacterium]|nr:pilus assembly PilX N-terminal domain-containing protein [Candidatus Staskawiczbacteria bacterium]